MASCSSLNFTAISSKPQKPPSSSISSPLVQRPFTSHLSFSKSSSLHSGQTLFRTHCRKLPQPNGAISWKAESLRILISGAPASGKGTQCELITKKHSINTHSIGLGRTSKCCPVREGLRMLANLPMCHNTSGRTISHH